MIPLKKHSLLGYLQNHFCKTLGFYCTYYIYMWNYQDEFSASHRWNLSLNNLSLFHCTAVKINSIVILSEIDWVWNCNQTATITLNQIDTTEINDVYKSPWNSLYIVILLVSVILYHGKMFLSWNVILAPYLRVYCIFRARIHSPFVRLDLSNQINPCQIHFQNNFNKTPLSQIAEQDNWVFCMYQFSDLALNLTNVI